ncbi:zinc-dependent alcohol dehydrogenase family protein [Paenibacillus favisporus]|uniref:zinc-dependent alcohol dehydrogenase family protein n=1 Tax=Paenibacillus favisporus TaxID=221028 RepID=UPI002DB8AB53|nr:zinc-dependent alcohol dehydrogenase family protein [Paenibacillus favisporus]MEC0174853.1 zinc-dependent alcohol dehydrogenase family protein [Paenibacillus favisporus]
MKFVSLQYNEFGDPRKVIETEYREHVPLQYDEVWVRMSLSPINPSDLIPIRGAYKHRIRLPAIPGYEGVGIVEKIGSSVSASLLGKRVLPLRGEGTWQEYVKTKANFAVLVPDGIEDETASQIYINPVTAWLICSDELRLNADDVLLVNACGSAIGRLFTQFSNILGFRLIAVVRNDVHTEELQSLGAWAVINTAKEPLIDRVMELTDGAGATAGIDSIGGPDGESLIDCIRLNGTVLSIGLLSGIQINWMKIHEKNPSINVMPYWLRRWVEVVSDAQWHQTFINLFQMVKENNLIIRQEKKRFKLTEYKKAIEMAEQDGEKGKVLFAPTQNEG